MSTGSDAQLPFHEIEVPDQLRNGVLDLEARVQLDERDVSLGRDEKLGGAGILVADLACKRRREDRDLLALGLLERRARRLFDQLLMAPLDGAVALAKRQDLAVRVGEQLHLDMVRALHKALEVDPIVSERGHGLAARRLDGVVEFARLFDDAHASPAAAGRGFDDQRIPELASFAARERWNARSGGDVECRQLVAGEPKRGRRWPDPDESGRLDAAREVRLLGEEPVSGVHRARSGTLCRLDDLVECQIGADASNRVGRAGVERIEVVLGRDCDGGDPKLAAGLEDAVGDFAAVGYEKSLEQRHRLDLVPPAGRALLEKGLKAFLRLRCLSDRRDQL